MIADFYGALGGFGGAPALIAEDHSVTTYADLAALADTIGRCVPRRCVVFSICENGVESVAGYLGFLRSRVVPLLVNSSISRESFDSVLHTYWPAYVWLPRDRAGFVPGGREVFGAGRYVLLESGPAGACVLHDDLALLLTTSGSTGSPVLVRQSYTNIASNARAIAEYLRITPRDRPITTLPMSYTFGLSIINSHLLQGCPIVLSNKSVMDKAFWTLLRASGATTFSGVPYIYEMLKKLRFARMDVPSLKVLTQAGGKLGVDLSREFAAVCQQKEIRFIVMYGQVEATARISYLPSEYALSKAGSIGIAIPGGKLRLEDEDHRVISASDTVGELVYEGANVTLGYAESRADLGKGDENGGVLRTGDMARRDDDGFYYIVGRKKRFLKVFGHRINLQEVEDLINAQGYSCACAGEDDHLRIFTSDREHHAGIRNFVAERTSIHPSAFDVVYIERIPRNDAGKVLYSVLDTLTASSIGPAAASNAG